MLENKHLIDAVKNTVKLYDTMKDNIMELRSEAAKGIAKYASDKPTIVETAIKTIGPNFDD